MCIFKCGENILSCMFAYKTKTWLDLIPERPKRILSNRIPPTFFFFLQLDHLLLYVLFYMRELKNNKQIFKKKMKWEKERAYERAREIERVLDETSSGQFSCQFFLHTHSCGCIGRSVCVCVCVCVCVATKNELKREDHVSRSL